MGLIAGLGREQVPHGAEHGRGLTEAQRPTVSARRRCRAVRRMRSDSRSSAASIAGAPVPGAAGTWVSWSGAHSARIAPSIPSKWAATASGISRARLVRCSAA